MRRRIRRRKPIPVGELVQEKVTFACFCGALLRVGMECVDGHGICPKCRRRLLLTGKTDAAGRMTIHPLVLQQDRKSGATFMIQDHFREMPSGDGKIPFSCPCGKKLFALPAMVDRRAKCPSCGVRLLLVGKTHSRTHLLEIHPLVLDESARGDTFLIQG